MTHRTNSERDLLHRGQTPVFCVTPALGYTRGESGLDVGVTLEGMPQLVWTD